MSAALFACHKLLRAFGIVKLISLSLVLELLLSYYLLFWKMNYNGLKLMF